MLNRRFLRIKAMQAIYAFKQAEDAQYNLAMDFLHDYFSPDLNSMKVPDKRHINFCRKESQKAFEESHKTRNIPHNLEEEVYKGVTEAIQFYYNGIRENHVQIRQQMLEDTVHIHRNYFYCLQYLVELSDLIEELHEGKQPKYSTQIVSIPGKHLLGNPLIQQLRDDSQLRKEISRLKLTWRGEEGLLRASIRKILLNNKRFMDYCAQEERNFEEDKAILLYLLKKIVLEHELFQPAFEDEDIRWAENKAVIKGLIQRTFKFISEDEELTLIDLSENWEDDKAFFIKLFDETIHADNDIRAKISGHLRDWDMDRLAHADQIIMEMAITEMIIFPSIPVKVSINEYIELAKNYSTPKSKQYINGVLDALSKELIENKTIKKSGRGLIER